MPGTDIRRTAVSDDAAHVVVELAKRGKLVVGEPYFAPGVPLVIDRKGSGEARSGDLAVVDQNRRRARLQRVLGRANDIEAVLEGLLVHTGARTDFEPYDLPDPSLEGRVDLRDLTTFTIDPETAKDFDDALSIREEPEGLRAWVHIADVSAFVPAGSPLDRGAAERSFTTYVPGRAAPMLPPELADDRCSLRPYEDRVTVTVELPPTGTPSIYRSVIRSDARLTYGQAERREAAPDIAEALELTDRLTAAMRERRFARGALRIETPEIAFEFDGHGRVGRAWKESEPTAHRLVEELMIAANEAVAELLSSRRRAALYRVHERPGPTAIELLVAKLADLRVPTPPVPEHLSPAAAAGVAAAASELVMEYVKRSHRGAEAFPALVLRSLKQARYHPENLGHSGLASPAYCHFTSPIRRYPDLVVHRALLRELGLSDDPGPADLEALAEHTSAREREAAQIEYLADEICLAWLLEDELFERGWDAEWEGEVVGLIGAGLFVRFGEVFEGFLPSRRLGGDFFEPNALGTALAGRRGGGTYRLGDDISVRVEKVERAEGKIELAPAANRRRRRRE
ncbi:MAG: RNB domain-containing ribonuclease [Actinobacteria bacterium]|nr:MAG: RNB domain-containing ribonuclease [Actinomycetota bacterium]